MPFREEFFFELLHYVWKVAHPPPTPSPCDLYQKKNQPPHFERSVSSPEMDHNAGPSELLRLVRFWSHHLKKKKIFFFFLKVVCFHTKCTHMYYGPNCSIASASQDYIIAHILQIKIRYKSWNFRLGQYHLNNSFTVVISVCSSLYLLVCHLAMPRSRLRAVFTVACFFVPPLHSIFYFSGIIFLVINRISAVAKGKFMEIPIMLNTIRYHS